MERDDIVPEDGSAAEIDLESVDLGEIDFEDANDADDIDDGPEQIAA